MTTGVRIHAISSFDGEMERERGASGAIKNWKKYGF